MKQKRSFTHFKNCVLRFLFLTLRDIILDFLTFSLDFLCFVFFKLFYQNQRGGGRRRPASRRRRRRRHRPVGNCRRPCRCRSVPTPPTPPPTPPTPPPTPKKLPTPPTPFELRRDRRRRPHLMDIFVALIFNCFPRETR